MSHFQRGRMDEQRCVLNPQDVPKDQLSLSTLPPGYKHLCMFLFCFMSDIKIIVVYGF